MGVHPNLDWPHKADHFMRPQGGIACKQVSEVPGKRQDSLCFLWGDDGRLRAKVALGGVLGGRVSFSLCQSTLQPLSQLRPSPFTMLSFNGNGQCALLSNQHDETLAARNAGINQ